MSSFTEAGAGIVYNENNGRAKNLPLNSLAAHAFIIDVSARVVLSQVYSYDGEDMLPEAYYVFPVPARAAVCSFTMETNDGINLTGVVKTLEQAKEDYEKALCEKKLAGLLEQFRQDVFVLSIGSIYPKSIITVTISYVVDLSEDDQIDTIRFQLSSHVGARWGAPSTSILYHGTAHNAALDITVDVEMPGPIIHISSPNHVLQDVTLPAPPATQLSDSTTSVSNHSHSARKRFTSSSAFLEKDFLLVVQARGLDRPRCFIEHAVYRKKPSTALALTIVPRFKTTTIRSEQEYIFLIDRSTSMIGTKSMMARQTLSLLLNCLPATGTWFNIFSFATDFSSLWDRSQKYTQSYFSEAKTYTDGMVTNSVGTELLNAITHVIPTRRNTIPTNIFILTDGWVFRPELVLDCISDAVASASADAPLRVFTLGVGDSASTELCEGMATAGNGACSMTLEGENLMRKSMLLFDAMDAPKVEELSVDWGMDGQGKYHQVPYPSINLFPDQRLLVTTILPMNHIPAQAILRGRLSNGSSLLYEVPVQNVSSICSSNIDRVLGRSFKLPPLIHTLAAHRLIVALESKRALQLTSSSLTPRTQRNNLIEDLGIRHQIASSRTSFVATIDLPPLSENWVVTTSESYQKSAQSNGQSPGGEKPTTPESSHLPSHTTDPSPEVPGAFRSSWTRNTSSEYFTAITARALNATWEFLTVRNPLGELFPWSIFVAPPLPQDVVIFTWAKSQWSRIFRVGQTNSQQTSQSRRNGSEFPVVEDAAFMQYFGELFRLQSLDGSFTDISQISWIVGIPEPTLLDSLPPQLQAIVKSDQKVVWATAIAVASLRKRFAAQFGTWKNLEDKAVQYGSRVCGCNNIFEEIVQLASGLL